MQTGQYCVNSTFACALFLLTLHEENKNNQTYLIMKEFVKYLGVVLVLAGVVILIVHSQTLGASNSYLVAGMCCVTIGTVAHIIINKFVI